jgi:hypothetical protein
MEPNNWDLIPGGDGKILPSLTHPECSTDQPSLPFNECQRLFSWKQRQLDDEPDHLSQCSAEFYIHIP